MRLNSKLVAAAAGLVALGGVGTAVARTSSAAAPAHVRVVNASQVTPSGPADTDTVQSGDQTTPDSPADKADRADTAEKGDAESTAQADGPGGHEDPPGNVDHQSTTEQ